MNIIFKYIFLLILILSFACSPPRTRRFSSQKKQNSQITKPKSTAKKFKINGARILVDKDKANNKIQISKKQRFSDTSYINLNNIVYSEKPIIKKEVNTKKANHAKLTSDKLNNTQDKNKKAIINEYQIAISLFNDDKFDQASPIINKLIKEFSDSDTLKYEALFYRSECLIQEGKIKKSIRILLSLIDNKLSTASVLEKSLVRIGHLYCIENNKQVAEIYFNRLRIEFPKSLFIKLANCSVVNK